MFEFDSIQSILILAGLMFAGEYLSKKLKGMLPAVLVSALVLMLGVWVGIIPRDMVESTGFTALTSYVFLIIIADMGASMNLRRLWANRKVALLAAAALVFQIAMLLLVIGSVFGLNTALAGLPGGTSVLMVVQEREKALGYDELATLTLVLMSTQSLIGAPAVAALVKREVKRLRAHPEELMPAAPAAEPEGGERGGSVYLAFFKLSAAAWAASRLEMLTGFSRYAFSLLIGVLLSELGFLKGDELERTNSKGLIYFITMTVVLSGFCRADAATLKSVLLPAASILACDVAAICVFAPLLGRRLGFSGYMSTAIGMQILIGFPLNMMITQDIVALAADGEEERKRLVESVGTRLVIAGIISLTTLSVIFASLLVHLMK